MQAAGVTETHRASKNSGTRKMHLSGFLHNRFIERLVLKAIILSEENAQKHRVLGYLHLVLLEFTRRRDISRGFGCYVFCVYSVIVGQQMARKIKSIGN